MQSLCQFMDGVLCVDKPAGASSAGAVNRVKRLLPRGTKIGHAGTLDPFATGVLLMLIGKATKLCESFMDQPKQYHAIIRLGATTATDDPETKPISWPNFGPAAIPPRYDSVDYILSKFVGQILQQPPVYSALKVSGRTRLRVSTSGANPKTRPTHRQRLFNPATKLRLAHTGDQRRLRSWYLYSRTGQRRRCRFRYWWTSHSVASYTSGAIWY